LGLTQNSKPAEKGLSEKKKKKEEVKRDEKQTKVWTQATEGVENVFGKKRRGRTWKGTRMIQGPSSRYLSSATPMDRHWDAFDVSLRLEKTHRTWEHPP